MNSNYESSESKNELTESTPLSFQIEVSVKLRIVNPIANWSNYESGNYACEKDQNAPWHYHLGHDSK